MLLFLFLAMLFNCTLHATVDGVPSKIELVCSPQFSPLVCDAGTDAEKD